jgi:RNA polymerase primary sigma factor
MPRAARFRIEAIAELRRQLAYAPPETLRRQMEAAEALIESIEPGRNYPHEFVIFRVTGYRADMSDGAVTLVGDALLGDLGVLILQLSEAIELRADERPGGALRMEELAVRWRVSTKSIQRYRRLGLACHFMRFDDGERRVGCYVETVRRFEARRAGLLEGAASYSRIDAETEQAIVAEAAALRRASPLTLNQAAGQLAKRHRRSRETIRQILRRHGSAKSLFTERGPLSAKERALVLRAARWGVSLGDIADRLGRQQASIHRVVCVGRAEALRRLSLRWIELPTFALPEAEAVILAPAAVARPQITWPATHDAVELLKQMAGARPLAAAEETMLLAGYNLLKRAAGRGVEALGARPGATPLDEIETYLRWAALLKSRIVWSNLPAILRRSELVLGRRVTQLRPEEIRGFVRAAFAAAGSAAELFDPSRSQTLERWWRADIDREVGAMASTAGDKRAGVRHPAGTVGVEDPFDRVCAWQAEVGPPAAWRGRSERIEAGAAAILAERFGWRGEPPRTLEAMARRLGLSTAQVSRKLARAISSLRGTP